MNNLRIFLAVFTVATFYGCFAQRADLSYAGVSVPVAASAQASAGQEKLLILSAADRDLYKLIFSKQEAGDMKTATRAIEKLQDQRLMGHVLYQRYMHPSAYTSRYHELKAWLEAYGDQPGADKIYALAVKKAGSSDRRKEALQKPKALSVIPAHSDPSERVYTAGAAPYSAITGYDRTFQKKVERALRARQADKAVDWVYEADRKSSVPDVQLDALKALLAERYMLYGQTSVAYELAHQAYKRSGSRVPMAGWVCGLISWEQGYYEAAARYFKSAAISSHFSEAMQSAASFWAARAYRQMGKRYQAKSWFEKAALHPRSFYGLLAVQLTGAPDGFYWDEPVFTSAMHKVLQKNARVMRGMALLDIGQYGLAQDEFLAVSSRDNQVRRGLLALASHYNLPHLALRLGSILKGKDATYYDAALYPDMDKSLSSPLFISSRHKIDQALVHAIIRQESRFNPYATSRSGARGLMQLMPATAKHVATRYGMDYGRQSNLYDPSVNVALGQRYVHELLGNSAVNGDIVAMLLAYNAGPGTLSRFRDTHPDMNDPLLMIELFPRAETRKYVERVLSHYWMYRIKEGRDLQIVEALVDGQPLDYVYSISDQPYALVQNAR